MADQAFQPFQMHEHLIGLHAKNFKTHIESVKNKGKSQADWIIGLKDFDNTLALHGQYWEKHPKGDETLLLLSGEILLSYCNAKFKNIQSTLLRAGEVLIVPQNTWHRLEVLQVGQLMFFTPATGSKIAKVEEDFNV